MNYVVRKPRKYGLEKQRLDPPRRSLLSPESLPGSAKLHPRTRTSTGVTRTSREPRSLPVELRRTAGEERILLFVYVLEVDIFEITGKQVVNMGGGKEAAVFSEQGRYPRARVCRGTLRSVSYEPNTHLHDSNIKTQNSRPIAT